MGFKPNHAAVHQAKQARRATVSNYYADRRRFGGATRRTSMVFQELSCSKPAPWGRSERVRGAAESCGSRPKPFLFDAEPEMANALVGSVFEKCTGITRILVLKCSRVTWWQRLAALERDRYKVERLLPFELLAPLVLPALAVPSGCR